MKKLTLTIMTIIAIAAILSGCGSTTGKNTDTNAPKTLSIVTTIFPEYDWVREITKGNDNVEITMLLDKSVDLHSFQPSAEDIIKVSSCDMFIYVGGESDKWADEIISGAGSRNMAVINLLDVLGDSVKEEELVEGMQGEEEESEEEGPEYDEHVWLSLKNAGILCEHIEKELEKIDEKNSSLYASNTEKYLSALDSLDKSYEAAISDAPIRTVLFGDRFPFRYMTDDYGLDYYAAFVGCSAESEASFETVIFLAEKIDEMKLPSIIQIENSDGKIANAIKDATASKDQAIITLNSMQAVTSKDVENGAKYLDIMQSNLEELKKATGYGANASDGTAAPSSDASDSKAAASDVDVDVSLMSGTMVYAEVFNMMNNPESYIGKKVKLAGVFNTYEDSETGKRYFSCIVSDATGCCEQGIEFQLTGEHNYPEDYPDLYSKITVTGTFETYMEDGQKYGTLMDAELL